MILFIYFLGDDMGLAGDEFQLNGTFSILSLFVIRKKINLSDRRAKNLQLFETQPSNKASSTTGTTQVWRY
jgi:hypothetical protein